MKLMLLRLLACTVSLGFSAAHAQYPPGNQPVRLILSTPPGGGSDTAVRLVAELLAPAIGRQVLVDNRPGAGGVVAATAVAHAPPDGFTLLVTSVSASPVAPLLFKSLPYKVQDLQPVYRLASAPLLVLVPADASAKSLTDLVTAAQKSAGGLNFGTYSIPSRAAMELLGESLKFKVNTVGYKTSAQLMTDLAAGRLDVAVVDVSTASAMMKANRLRPVAIMKRERSRLAPDVPTVYESGYSGNEVLNWIGIFAPAGVPAPMVRQLSTEVHRIMSTPKVRAQMEAANLDLFEDGGPDSYPQFAAQEYEAYSLFIKRTGFEPQ
ncbi:MAG: Bug family tripartite tricarboxylate transporter substrate binding protein [Burkholderiaceae bacterium]